MKKLRSHSLLIISTVLLFCAVSCQQERKENKIVISKALVCEAYSFGLVGNGSCLFSYKDAIEGYSIQIRNGNTLVGKYYCRQNELNTYIEKIYYEYGSKDSIIILPPK